MATTITAGNSTNGGAAISSDNTGILELKTGTGSGTTALTLSTAQAATFAGAVSVTGNATLPTIRSNAVSTPPTIQDSAGTQIGTFCRAFVNFNGTTNVGGFCTIRASFNVTTVADNGTGDYTVNLTNALPDANYAVVAMAGGFAGGNAPIGFYETTATARTASLVRLISTQGASAIDGSFESVAIFR
jgi:hypothetical protein